jgi:Flp pilus assembly pilin Flp
MFKLSDESGQTLVEYGLILTLVVIVVVATIITAGDAVLTLWNHAIAVWPA